MALEACSDLCCGEGYRHLKHASGTRHDDNLPGDNNCSCCSGTRDKNTDDGWGIRVFGFPSPADVSTDSTSRAKTIWRLLLVFMTLV